MDIHIPSYILNNLKLNNLSILMTVKSPPSFPLLILVMYPTCIINLLVMLY